MGAVRARKDTIRKSSIVLMIVCEELIGYVMSYGINVSSREHVVRIVFSDKRKVIENLIRDNKIPCKRMNTVEGYLNYRGIESLGFSNYIANYIITRGQDKSLFEVLKKKASDMECAFIDEKEREIRRML